MTDRTLQSRTGNNQNDFSGRPEAAKAIDSLVDSGAAIAQQVGNAASQVSRQVTDAASGAIEAGTNAATYAADQAKSLTSEIETFARRNPLGALAGALAVGVLIGMLGRGRG
jgi:ElaB/YqjD/DUF883 family membrane-anchored ribosome-binding protein